MKTKAKDMALQTKPKRRLTDEAARAVLAQILPKLKDALEHWNEDLAKHVAEEGERRLKGYFDSLRKKFEDEARESFEKTKPSFERYADVALKHQIPQDGPRAAAIAELADLYAAREGGGA